MAADNTSYDQLALQKMICLCHVINMRNDITIQKYIEFNEEIKSNITPKLLLYYNELCIKSINDDIANLLNTDYSKIYLNTITASATETIQNFNSNTIVSIKSNIGDLKLYKADYINFKGELKQCLDLNLENNRALGDHLRTYLFYINQNNNCFNNSLMARISLEVQCPKYNILTISTICEDEKKFIELFIPANIDGKLYDHNKNINNKKNILIVIPFVNISQYYGGIANHNNYSVEKLFIKSNISLPLKLSDNILHEAQYYLLLSYFIESINRWNVKTGDKFNIKYIYDFSLNDEILNEDNILLFPHHNEYLDISFLDSMIEYNKLNSNNKIKILNFAAANLFRPITISEDSIILYTKNKSDIVDEHVNKINELCLPIYKNNYCSKDLSDGQDWDSINKELIFNKQKYFPICSGGRVNYYNEAELFDIQFKIIDEEKDHYPYIGEYSEAECNNKVLFESYIKGKKFSFITISENKNIDIFNVNTNGLGINFFTSNIAVDLLEKFLE